MELSGNSQPDIAALGASKSPYAAVAASDYSKACRILDRFINAQSERSGANSSRLKTGYHSTGEPKPKEAAINKRGEDNGDQSIIKANEYSVDLGKQERGCKVESPLSRKCIEGKSLLRGAGAASLVAEHVRQRASTIEHSEEHR